MRISDWSSDVCSSDLLDREISKIARKIVKELLTDKAKAGAKAPRKVSVTPRNLEKYLGVHRYDYGIAAKDNQVGPVTGLAWTEVGGDLLTIESVLLPGKGKDISTGKMEEVMQE